MDKRSERGGSQDRCPEYVKEKKDSPQSAIKKEEKTPQQKPQIKKKKVAALTVKNASSIENTVEEQEVGRDSVGQRGRAHESRDLSTFSFGSQKRFCRLPQGYKNGPGLFSASVTSILHELDSDALSYVDDIYLTDDALDIHLARLDLIILGFADLGYKCNFKKSKIAFLSVLFLGYELSNEGKSLACTS
ncbi:hypothetical protein NDU88_010072 [Pleurodeles waltl]|uniref:ribonuclease H n=1 Tax=Pleurodeles waltl TaxID=8319 RepID=A0AAV7QUN2_PLEWA|nr:hypothetical protein NDU88_010072 [Pleurodeles waltl]